MLSPNGNPGGSVPAFDNGFEGGLFDFGLGLDASLGAGFGAELLDGRPQVEGLYHLKLLEEDVFGMLDTELLLDPALEPALELDPPPSRRLWRLKKARDAISELYLV